MIHGEGRLVRPVKSRMQVKKLQYRLRLNTFLLLFLAACADSAQYGKTSPQLSVTDEKFLLTYPNLEDSQGEVVLENEHVVVQRLVVPAGKWEGVHSHPGNQLYVHIKGGEWTGRLGDQLEYSEEISPDGEVGWMDAIPLSAEHDSGNTGDTPIDIIYVTLKSDEPIAPDGEHTAQHYPKIPMKLLLENDRMIVQRVQVGPGEWEGVHSHPGNQVFIHVKGGEWSGRRGGKSTGSTVVREDGAVGWMDAIDLSEEHESGNTGDTTIDLIWITLK